VSETRVWIAQCLCPARHAIMATAGEADSEQAASAIEKALREAVAVMLESGEVNPWCGLCRAGVETWRYEVGRTRFATMAEATPALAQSAAEQAALRAAFGDLPRSD
jgi:hypothetical protein